MSSEQASYPDYQRAMVTQLSYPTRKVDDSFVCVL
jgi:hypothetical protein